jgi:NAD-dependent deacetylase
MRPCAVLFGEAIPAAAEHATKRALRDCDLFVAIGTSGTVFPAAGFVRSAVYAGAHTVLLNLEIDVESHEAYRECHEGPADELVPQWFG